MSHKNTHATDGTVRIFVNIIYVFYADFVDISF